MALQYSSYVAKELLSNTAIVSGGIAFSNITLSGNVIVSGTGAGTQDRLDDISPYFNGETKSFTLSVNGTTVIPKSFYSVQIYLGGVLLHPPVYLEDNNHLSPIRFFDSGYLLQGSSIIFPYAPARGLPFQGIINYLASHNYQEKLLPFRPINIMMAY